VKGFSLVETIVALVIVGVLAGIGVVSIVAMRKQDSVDRASGQVQQDLLTIRSQAIASGKLHRLRWISDTQWVLERYDDTLATPAWVQTGDIHRMPNDIYLMSGSLANAGSNLEATPRGTYQFQNGKTGTPYLTIEGVGVSRTKSFYVYTGGAIEIRTP
jgi:prepilin-type N-terminal cleavage/methylation domain-containing protein